MNQLLENSLYKDPTERAALVADKKRVMDALCFSLLGFLGCFQLASSRSFLKTYEATEGKLQLSSIGDANHDVSLAVKLAEEAGCIPTSAAMNITKLLYKIKTKALKAGDLNDDTIRGLITAMKFSVHRPDPLVYNAVEQFEQKHMSLPQLAFKLYNISKMKQFQSVSGEFRQLVMKGQYQELFNKLPKIVTPAPASPTAVVPAAASQVHAAPTAPIVSTARVPKQDELDKLFKGIMRSSDYYKTADMIRLFIASLKLSAAEMEAEWSTLKIGEKLAAWLNQKVFVERDGKFVGIEWLVFGKSKWIYRNTGQLGASEFKIRRAIICARFLNFKSKIEVGAWQSLSDEVPIIGANDSDGEGFKEYWTKEYLEKLVNEYLPTCIGSGTYPIALVKLKGVIQILWTISGHSSRVIPTRPEGSSEFELTPMMWLVRADATKSKTNCREVFGDLPDPDMIAGLNKIFDVPVGKSVVAVPREKYGYSLQIPCDITKVKGQAEFLAKLLTNPASSGSSLSARFFDLNNWANDVKKLFNACISNNLYGISNRFWVHFCEEAPKIPGFEPGYLTSEPWLDWMSEQFEGDRIKVFLRNVVILEPAVRSVYLTSLLHLIEKKGISAALWLAGFQEAVISGVAAYVKDFKDIFNEKFSILKDRISQALDYVDWTNVDIYGAVLKFLDPIHKDIKIINEEFWYYLAEKDPTRFQEWDMPLQIQWGIFGRLGKSYIANCSELRAFMMKKYSDVREKQYAMLMTGLNKGEWGDNALSAMCNQGFFDVVEENEIPKDFLDKLETVMETFGTTKTSIALNTIDKKFKPWFFKRLKEAFVKAPGKVPNTATIGNAQVLLNAQEFESFMKDIPQDVFNQHTFVSNLYSNSIGGYGYTTATQMAGILKKMEQQHATISKDTLQKMLITVGIQNQSNKSNFTKELREPCIDAICQIFNNMSASGREQEIDHLFDGMSYAPEMKKTIAEWFSKTGVLHNALNAVKNDVVKPLVEIDQKRLGALMKYNNIKIPSTLVADLRKQVKLSDLMKTQKSFSVEPLAITEEDITDKEMLQRTVEYDAFNKYRHGQIGVEFLKSFHVDIPIQREKNKEWDEAHQTARVMDPVFHGTGSVAASFILRYGFAVVSSNDASVVGRMLGDGIYFSNVLDKCGQYVSDGGYSRGIGNEGYLFQMRANLGNYGTDFAEGHSGLISPEWCVFHPNDQLKIYKAHFIRLVPQSKIKAIKTNLKINENTALKVKYMTQHLNENIQTQTGMVSYTFVDGTIPIDDQRAVAFEEFDTTEFGDHLILEPSALGPVLYIKTELPSSEVYVVRYTTQFMNQGDDFQNFLQLLGRKPATEK